MEFNQVGELSGENIKTISERSGKEFIWNTIYAIIECPRKGMDPELEAIAEAVAAIDQHESGWKYPSGSKNREYLVGVCKDLEGPRFLDRIKEAKLLDPLCDPSVKAITPPSPFGPSPKSSRTSETTTNLKFRRWKTIAGLHINLLGLNTAEEDLLNYIEKTIVERRGHGVADPAASSALMIPLLPEKLAKKGKRCGKSSYEKARARLTRLGIIAFMGYGPQGRKLFSPAWDQRLTDSPEAIFIEAARRAKSGEDSAEYWRTNEDRSANDPLHTPNAQLIVRIELTALGEAKLQRT